MLNLDQGIKAVRYAREVIEESVKNKNKPNSNLEGIFSKNYGAFVTLNTYPDLSLRGCIGIPMPVMSLRKAIAEGAQSATHDPRFPHLAEYELDDITVEVTILSPPDEIKVNDSEEYLENIKIGRDGLIVEKGFCKGLLLPQVPVEHNWNKKTFLSQTCMKAGLPPDSWLDEDTKILKFSGQVFYETKPRGEIKEKKLDGSNS